ncbi:site-specific integrase [Chakrabartyella piscis]|uniref:site-specific integrase n=1 Tax=Chakrabartyella piscis TaxID=2918914 RepID=UPI0029584FA0|nr:site-specific integrase [Chakrabartyella piscis]
MAKATKLASGQWRAQAYSHTEIVDGKQKKIRESFTAPTKKEAEYLAAKFKMQNKRTEIVNISLGDAMEGYIDSKDGILSPSTVRQYRQIKRTYLLDLQSVPLKAITNLKIQIALNQDYKEKELSPKTMRNISSLLSSSIQLYNDDFRYRVTLPEKERYQYHLPTQSELSSLLRSTEGTKLRTAILLAICLGLRRGEICALQWSDFDYEQKLVQINKAMVLDEKGRWQIKKPKSYAGIRTLSVSDGLIAELKKIDAASPMDGLSPTRVSQQFARALKKEGLKKFRFHDLRHFNASTMMAEGIPDKYAIERMGHSTTAILKSVYQHTEDAKRAETDKVINHCIDTFLENSSHESSHKIKNP